MATELEDEELLGVLKGKVPDVTEREAQLVALIWTVYPYIPPALINMETGESVASRINKWMEETYGFRFRKTEGK